MTPTPKEIIKQLRDICLDQKAVKRHSFVILAGIARMQRFLEIKASAPQLVRELRGIEGHPGFDGLGKRALAILYATGEIPEESIKALETKFGHR